MILYGKNLNKALSYAEKEVLTVFDGGDIFIGQKRDAFVIGGAGNYFLFALFVRTEKPFPKNCPLPDIEDMFCLSRKWTFRPPAVRVYRVPLNT